MREIRNALIGSEIVSEFPMTDPLLEKLEKILRAPPINCEQMNNLTYNEMVMKFRELMADVAIDEAEGWAREFEVMVDRLAIRARFGVPL